MKEIIRAGTLVDMLLDQRKALLDALRQAVETIPAGADADLEALGAHLCKVIESIVPDEYAHKEHGHA